MKFNQFLDNGNKNFEELRRPELMMMLQLFFSL